MTHDIRRIIVLRALFLGDLLCATPAFRVLKRQFPQAKITLVGLPWMTTLVERLPYLDHFMVFPGYPGVIEVPYDEARTAAFFDQTRATGYDLALQMHGSGLSTNGFVAALGAARTIGYALPGDTRLDVPIPHQADEHEVLRWLRLVERATTDAGKTPRFDMSREALQIDFPTTAAEQQQARALLALDDRKHHPSSVVGSFANAQDRLRSSLVIGLHPGCKDPARRWPVERFAVVANSLAEVYGARCVVTGGSEERALAESLCQQVHAPIINLAGQTNLGAFAAVISKLDLLLSNDTGAAHFATAAGTPSVVLYGPSQPQQWGALNQQRHTAIDSRVVTGQHEDGALALATLPVAPVLDTCFAKLGVAERTVGALSARRATTASRQ